MIIILIMMSAILRLLMHVIVVMHINNTKMVIHISIDGRHASLGVALNLDTWDLAREGAFEPELSDDRPPARFPCRSILQCDSMF